jgi:hypothetical protein
MPNIEKLLELSQRVLKLRSELNQAEAELASFTGRQGPAQPAGRGTSPPSVSQRVLNMVRDAGAEGIRRADILRIIDQESAVTSALKVHSSKGIIISRDGSWVARENLPGPPTRPMRAVQPQNDSFITGG